ncbi:hypothetical protein TNCV_798071 [Trichonephila clavipes]|nr:hypothetical protein TNCV_798071 [Trichonephila clavipes]
MIRESRSSDGHVCSSQPPSIHLSAGNFRDGVVAKIITKAQLPSFTKTVFSRPLSINSRHSALEKKSSEEGEWGEPPK